MLEASLGYYINPLVNVLLGMLILGERLRRMQWIAVGLAAVGVAQQVWQVGSLPWVSLVLALTFGFYGLIRKQAPVKALPGLVVETWMLVPIAVAWLLFNQTATSAQPEFWTTSASLVAGRRRAGHAGAAGVLQRRHTPFALHHHRLPAIPGADPGAAASGIAVRRTLVVEHAGRVHLYLGGAGRLQRRRRGSVCVDAADQKTHKPLQATVIVACNVPSQGYPQRDPRRLCASH